MVDVYAKENLVEFLFITASSIWCCNNVLIIVPLIRYSTADITFILYLSKKNLTFSI